MGKWAKRPECETTRGERESGRNDPDSFMTFTPCNFLLKTLVIKGIMVRSRSNFIKIFIFNSLRGNRLLVMYTEPVIRQQCFLLTSFLAHVLNPIISPNWKFNQSSILPHKRYKLFPTVKKTFYGSRVVEKIKCMVMYQYPTCDVHFVHRKMS